MALPYGTTGSLSPTFVSARHIRLTVKHPSTFALDARLPTGLRVPLDSSVTFLEETAPVKLPNWKCPLPGFTGNSVRTKICPGWYFKVGSTDAGAPASTPPTYPTQNISQPNTSLQ